VTFEGKRATGVECIYEGKTYRIGARLEVVLSLGAINTPKVLMQSGIGSQAQLQRLGIPVVHHLPGVGRNFEWSYPGSVDGELLSVWSLDRP
jgi:choline dehydrogenase